MIKRVKCWNGQEGIDMRRQDDHYCKGNLCFILVTSKRKGKISNLGQEKKSGERHIKELVRNGEGRTLGRE